jgi:hypothetical protein
VRLTESIAQIHKHITKDRIKLTDYLTGMAVLISLVKQYKIYPIYFHALLQVWTSNPDSLALSQGQDGNAWLIT